MTKLEAAKLVAVLTAAYPSAKVTDRTSEAFEHMLADLDGEVASKAVARIIATSRFFPSIAEIRETVTDLECGAIRAGGDAWCDVLEQSRRVGYTGRPRFDDPIVRAIVARWGWRALCLSETGAADRARFIELYEALAKRERADRISGVALPAPAAHRALPGGQP